MRKFFHKVVFASMLSVAMLSPIAVLAVTNSTADSIAGQLNAAGGAQGAGLKNVDPRETVANIIKVVLTLVGTIMFALNIYAGYLWMTAGGNEEQVEQAKTTIRNATIGIVIVLGAYGITIAATNLATGNTISSGTANNAQPLENAVQKGLFGN